MSANGDSGPGRREVAYRLFAAEFDDASLSYSESDEERAPNYVVTPTGLRVNRLFAVGVVTEVESINEDTLRGRIVDPTGAFVTYAGQYQPEAHAFLDRTTPPAFVAITGKARTFEPEDSDRVFTSVRPESLSEVDSDTRDRWVVSAAKSTLHRIAVCTAALDSGLRGEQLETALDEAGIEESLAVGIPRALDHYETTTAYLEGLRQLAVDALELIADERDEVRSLDLAPGEGGEAALGALPSVDIELDGEQTPAAEPETAPTPDSATEETETPSPSATESEETADMTTETADTAADDATDSTAEESTDPAAREPADAVGDESVDSEPDIPADSPTEAVDDSVSAVEPDSEAANGASEPDATAEAASAADTADEESVDEAGMYQLDEEEREELESEFDTGFSSGNEVDPAGEAGIDVPDADELAEKAEAETGAATDAGADADGTTTEPATDETTDDELGEFDSGLGEFEDDSPSAAEPATDEESGAADTESVADDDTAATDKTPESPANADSSTDSEPATDEPPAEDIDLEETVVGTMAEMDDGDGVDRAELVASVVESYGVEDGAVEDAIDDALMGGRCYEPGEGVLKAI